MNDNDTAVDSGEQPGTNWRDIQLEDGTAIRDLAVEEPGMPNPASWAELRGYAWADDGTGDMTPPFPLVRLTAAGSRMEGAQKHVGEWHHSDLDEYSEVLDVVLLKRARNRALFGIEDVPLCSSADGLHPKANQRLWLQPEFKTKNGATVTVPWTRQPERCEDCPFAGTVGDGGDWEAGECRANRLYLAVRWQDQSPVVVRVTSTQSSGIERFIKQRIAGRKRPLCSMRLWLRPERVQPPRGNPYYIVRVDGEEVAAEVAIDYNNLLWRETERFEQSMALVVDADGRAVDARTGEIVDA